MNAVEIEEAISQLADQSFDAQNFPYAFLEAFGNKETTIKRLRAGASNKSDLGGVLQTNNIHIATCDAGQGWELLEALETLVWAESVPPPTAPLGWLCRSATPLTARADRIWRKLAQS